MSPEGSSESISVREGNSGGGSDFALGRRLNGPDQRLRPAEPACVPAHVKCEVVGDAIPLIAKLIMYDLHEAGSGLVRSDDRTRHQV